MSRRLVLAAALSLTSGLWAISWTSGTAAAASAASSARTRTQYRRASANPLADVLYAPGASERDREIGEAARRAIGRRGSAAVALDPFTGRILAIVNPRYALFHAYQPCSVFKIAVALAGLAEGAITPETHLTCNGGCWMWPGHGSIDLRRALAVSCNPFFEQIGEKIGWDKVERYARLLGLGSPSGVNLKGEAPGIVPAFVKPSDVGHTSSHGAGVRTSALQLAVMMAATQNGGIVWQPQLAAASGFVPRERWRLPEGTRLDALFDGFSSAVSEGSASPAFEPELVVAGKTGSCSGVGWFASFAPAARPELVLVTFVRGGNGSKASALAGRIYRDVFRVATTTEAP